MNLGEIMLWLQGRPLLALAAIVVVCLLLFVIARFIVARFLYYVAARSETRVDDIIVEHLHPFRVAWMAPLIFLYAFAFLLPGYDVTLRGAALFLILWVGVITIVSLLNALNEVYESNPSYSGVSIMGYLDVLKILLFMVAVILSVSLFTGQSPLALLAGLGALMAVLLLIFRDTILSIVASIRISTNDLIKEGDWIEVPSYEADGDVLDISLHAIKVRNFDKTISVVPTYKMVDVPYKNWRGMQESGGRRIKREIYLDVHSIKFCDSELLERARQIDLVKDFVDGAANGSGPPASDGKLLLNEPHLTNSRLFRAYIESYLRHHDGIHQQELSFLVRPLAPGPTGLPLQIYAFTKTVDWYEYERIQADIFDHLLAAAASFDLRIFQFNNVDAAVVGAG